MLIYIIRHGETNGNRNGVLQGWSNQPLNDNGRKLAVVTAKALANVQFDVAYSSPLSRANETAEIILRYNNNPTPKIIIDQRIKEINFGEWEGLGITKENFSIPSERFNEFYSDTFNFPHSPSGESTWDVVKRTGDFLNEVLNNPEYQQKTILVATHGFALRALLHHLYEDKTDFWHGGVPANCCVNVIEKNQDGVKLIDEDHIFYEAKLIVDPYKAI